MLSSIIFFNTFYYGTFHVTFEYDMFGNQICYILYTQKYHKYIINYLYYTKNI